MATMSGVPGTVLDEVIERIVEVARPVLLPTVALFAAACTGTSDDGTGDEVTQNRISEPVGSEQRVSLVEELRIGSLLGSDEAEHFSQVIGVEIGPDGEIYALSRLDNDVRVFSSAGDFLRSWGRRGEGPGDFQMPHDLAVARDTIAITDGVRVHFFDLAGRFLTSVWPGGQAGRYSVATVFSTDVGWVVGRGLRQFAGASREPTGLQEVRYLDAASGALSEAIITYDREPDRVHLSRVSVSPAFARFVDYGVDRQGNFYLSNGMDYELSVYSSEGVLTRTVRMDVEPVPVTDDMLEEVRRAALERCRIPGRRRLCERPGGYLDTGLPAVIARANRQVPAFSRFLVAPDGHLLIRRADLVWDQAGDNDTRPHDLISPDGRFVGRVDIPTDFRPLILRDERVFGVVHDELGVPYIVKYRLEARRSPVGPSAVRPRSNP